MKNVVTLITVGMLLAVMVMVLGGCLTSEYKEYHYRINQDGSGEGTMKFVNLVSEEDDEQDVSLKDFEELISDYYEGEQFSEDNPHLTITDKKLYEEDGMLMGEVVFTFDNADSIGFFQYEDCDCCPWMLYIGSISETFLESNGTYLGADRDFPMIIWEEGQDEFNFKTHLKEDMSDGHGLLALYKTWLDTQ